MGLSFLAPLFLVGLLAVAVPIIIHLTNRPRRTVQPFPSLVFLRRIPFRSVKRQRISHWWLFLVRSALIVLAVVAFARPLMDRLGGVSATLLPRRELVVLLDHSLSMGYGDHWQRAVGAAREALEGIGANDRATLVVFSDRAQAVAQETPDKAALLAALETVRVDAGGTRFAPALELAADVLARSDLPRREVVLISDFQRAGWNAQDDIRLPAGTQFRPVSVAEPDVANIAVSGLMTQVAHQEGRDVAQLAARVVNTGAAPAKGLEVALEVAGREVERTHLDVEPRGTGVVRFKPVPLADRPVRVAIAAGTDGLPADNRLYAVLSPGDAIPVLVLVAPAAREEETLFLRRALALGTAPRFAVTVRRADNVRAPDIAAARVVLLDDAPVPRGAIGQRLREAVRQGTGLFAALGRRSQADAWGQAGDFVGGHAGGAVDRSEDRGASVAVLAYDHPVFDVFRAPRSGDFTSVTVFRYRRFEPSSQAGVQVLAQYDDGAPALVSSMMGRGRILVWTSGLDNFWTDLPIQPVFLPFVHQAVRYLTGYEERDAALVVGQTLDLGTLDLGDGQLVVETPSGKRETRAAGSYRLEEQGFYTVRPLAEEALQPRLVAVNVDPTESDLSPVDPAQLATAAGASAQQPGEQTLTALTPAERERRQGMWWYLAIGALALLVGDTYLSNRLARQRRVTAPAA